MKAARLALLLVLAVSGPASRADEAFEVNERLGALEYRYDFALAAARGRFQPRLTIEYSSKNTQDAGVGVGWTLSTSRIEKIVVGTTTRFLFVKDGTTKALVSSASRDGTGFYVPDVEDGYLAFRQVDTATWEALDADGSRYAFTTVESVPDVWYLTKVTDADGNRTEFGYATGRRVSSIAYNFYDAANPSSTSAVPSTATTYASYVDLEYDAGTGALKNVRLENKGIYGFVTVRRYEFAYLTVATTGARVLQTITEIGKESGVRLKPTAFEFSSPNAPNQPSAVVTPLGRRFGITYSSSTSFGDTSANQRYIVTSVLVTGPGLPGSTTAYWYQTPVTSTRWYDGASDYRGFSRSWAQSSADQIVRSAWWEVYSSAFVGRAAAVEWGTPTSVGTPTVPPTYAAFRRSLYEHTARSVGGSCHAPTVVFDGIAFASPLNSSFFPVTTLTSRERKSNWVDGLELANEKTTSCADVDDYGNVKARRMDPDVLRAGDEFFDKATFMVAANPASACKDCVDTATKTDLQGNVLSYERHEYGSTWQLIRIWMKPQAASPEVEVTSWSYNGNGTLRSKTERGVTYSQAYDSYQLRPEHYYVADAAKTLVTDVVYDDYGYESLVTGPYVYGGVGSYQRGIAYDDLGRPRVVSRRPITGSTIYDALIAFEYFDYSESVPASLRVHSFTLPVAYTEPNIPQTADVRQRTFFIDAAGRVIQVRERLGGTALGDPMARITQNLTGYRVSQVAIYDGAGHVTAAFDPFLSAGSAFVDYRTSPIDNLYSGDPAGLSSALHVTLRGFDARGREVCDLHRVMPSGSRIPTLTSCTSSFDENPSYARAVATSYRGVTVNGINYVGVKEIPAENNAGTTPEGRAPNGPESFFDASGKLRWRADVDQNLVTFLYDLLGRATDMVRDVSDGSKPSITTTITYDMMGRIARRTDPNVGTRDFSYDTEGRLWRIELPRHVVGQDSVGTDLWARDEIQTGFDLGRLATADLCTASAVASGGTYVVQLSCRRESTLVYDTPYKSDPVYENVGGRLSWAANGLTTIAYGYNPEGVPVRRDQAIAGVTGTFSNGEAALLDGQAAHSDFTSPYGTFSYQTSYDSMRRPVQIDSGSAVYWQALSSLSTGGYDAIGRVAAVDVDANRVHSTWQYAPYSALEQGERVSIGSTDVFHVTGETYKGSKLASYRDELGSTTYRYWYSDTGRLKAAQATPTGSSALAQNALVCASFNVSKRYGPGPSFGNLERVRDQAVSPPNDERYAYGGTGLETSAPPGPDAVTAITSAASYNPVLYDALGRVRSKYLGAEVFEYDLLNRLTRVTRTSGDNEVLSYDPTGKLLGRLVGTKVTYYLGDQATVSATVRNGCTGPGCDIRGNTITTDVHILAGKQRVATVRVGSSSTGRVLYYHRDRLGSVMATSLGGGVAGAQYRYGVYGAVTVAQLDSGDSASELGYAGALRLTGGLLVMGSRVYDPALRQFLQPDAVDPMTYTYAAGDPVNLVDPSGTSAVSIESVQGSIVASIGHVYGYQLLGPMPTTRVVAPSGSGTAFGGRRYYPGYRYDTDGSVPLKQDGGGGSTAEAPRPEYPKEEVIEVTGPRVHGDRTYYDFKQIPDIGGGSSVPSRMDGGGGGGGGGQRGGYVDVNVTGGYIAGATGGVQIQSGGNLLGYLGVALTTPGVSGAITASPTPPATGWNVAISLNLMLAGQIGWSVTSGSYWELGVAWPPGVSVSLFYVWDL